MTKEEYIAKTEKLLNKRNDFFNKITKCEKELKKISNEFAASVLPFNVGDKVIATNGNGNTEYLKVAKITPHYVFNGKKISEFRNITVEFKRVNENWVMPRRWDWCREFEITVYQKQDYQLPINWNWEVLKK